MKFRSTTNLDKVEACFVWIWGLDWVHRYYMSQVKHKNHNSLNSTKILSKVCGLITCILTPHSVFTVRKVASCNFIYCYEWNKRLHRKSSFLHKKCASYARSRRIFILALFYYTLAFYLLQSKYRKRVNYKKFSM